MEENYYKTLEVEREASDKDIKTAYRRLAMRWHPDKNPDKKHEAESKFKKISEAYNILGDTLKRVSYDYHHMEPSDCYYGCGTTEDAHTDFTYKYDKTRQRTQGEKREWMWCIWVTIIGIFVVPLMLLFSFIVVLDSIASWLYETFQ